jgi:hypothetical protein
MTGTSQRPWHVFVLMLALTCVAACGCSVPKGLNVHPSPRPGLTLELAKAETLKVENAIVDLVPRESVKGRRQMDKAPLLSCDTEIDLFMWPGHTFMSLNAGADISRLVKVLTEHWNAEPGYRAKDTTAVEGAPGVDIERVDGATFYVDFPKAQTEMRIASFSPCFSLPDGNNGEDY